MRMERKRRGFGPRDEFNGGRGERAIFGRGGGRGGMGRGRGDDLGGEGAWGGRHGRRGGGGRGEGGGAGMRRGRLFGREELRLTVLALLAEEPQHGYQLMRAFEEKSGGSYVPSPGVLYPLLAMLEEMGLTDNQAGDEGKRRLVTLSEAGRAELMAGKALADAAFAKLASLASAAARTDVAPVRRAMTNLKTALADRLNREGADAETAFAIAALIDEAAQKIERL